MRFILNKYEKFEKQHGIVRKQFALFPIRINDEVRWLETCYIHSVYFIVGDIGSIVHDWVDNKFVTKEDYLKYLKEREEFVKNNNIE
jgi:hypothetical protein